MNLLNKLKTNLTDFVYKYSVIVHRMFSLLTLFSSEIDFTYCAKSVNEVKLSHLCFSYVVVAFSLVIKMRLFLSVIVRIPL